MTIRIQKRGMFMLLLFIASFSIGAAAQTGQNEKGQTSDSVVAVAPRPAERVKDLITVPGFALLDGPTPEWANGTLFRLDSLFPYDPSRRNRLLVLRDDAIAAREVQINVPGAVTASIGAFTASRDGQIAVALGSADARGAISRSMAWLGPDAVVRGITSMDPFFLPHALVFANDGTLWAAGEAIHSSDPEGQSPHHQPTPQNFDLLRHYATDGKLIGSALSSQSLMVGDTERRFLLGSRGEAFLAAAGERIGYLCVSADEWVELSSDGRVLERWPYAWPYRHAFVENLAYLQNGDVYMRAAAVGPQNESQLLKLDKKNRRWDVLDPKRIFADGFGFLLGANRDSLVTWSNNRLLWYAVD